MDSDVRRMVRAGLARQVRAVLVGVEFYNGCHDSGGRFCGGNGAAGSAPYSAGGRAVAPLHSFKKMSVDPVWFPYEGLANTQRKAIAMSVHKEVGDLVRGDYVWSADGRSVLSAAKTLHVVYRLHQIGLGGLVKAGGSSGELFDLVNEKRPVAVKHYERTGMDEYVYRTSISGMYFAVGIDRADGRIKTAYPTNLALPPVNPRKERATLLERDKAREIIARRGGLTFIGAGEGERGLSDSEQKKLDRYVMTDFSYASKIQRPDAIAAAATANGGWRSGLFVLLTGEGYSVFDSGVLVGVFDSLDGAKSFVAGGGGSNE